ncbi:MAG: class I SAM-dependent methyltransferase [Polyangiales bacterium]
MKRTHWFEFEDLSWVPSVVRDGGTDLLDLGFSLTKFYRPLAPALVRALDESGAERIVDLCSGGGGGALAMHKELAALGRSAVPFELSDRYPNEGARQRLRAQNLSALEYKSEPVDAMVAPAGDSRALRTMFGALHHFTPEQVRSIFRALIEARVSFAFFDVAASPALRKLPWLLAPIALSVNMAMLSIATLALTPLVRPFRVSRLLLTYVVPLIPALVAWDGTVSALRAYAPDELLEIARSIPGADRYTLAAEQQGPALSFTAIAPR